MIGRARPTRAKLISAKLLAVVAVCTAIGGKVVAQPTPTDTSPLTIAAQGSFFVGGRELRSETLSTEARRDPVGTIVVDQVYVRYQKPVAAEGRLPLVLVHGCCLTGKSWETTPDGRMGWDEFFVRRGFPTYVIDQAWRGRSSTSPDIANAVKSGKAPPEQLPTVFAAGRESAWKTFRFGPEYPQVHSGLQFPMEAQAEFWKQLVPDWLAALPTPNPTVPALVELAKRLDGAVLVAHSQSGIYPFQAAALDRSRIGAIVTIEPGACPAVASDMTPYARLPILIVFGDNVEASALWGPRLPACRQFVEAANKAGGQVELAMLPEFGFKGNSHMIMLDRNSLAVADWLAKWLDAKVPRGIGR